MHVMWIQENFRSHGNLKRLCENHTTKLKFSSIPTAKRCTKFSLPLISVQITCAFNLAALILSLSNFLNSFTAINIVEIHALIDEKSKKSETCINIMFHKLCGQRSFTFFMLISGYSIKKYEH